MKKMQCEVCGSSEIKKVSDGIFECQSCGVQYNTDEIKKMMVELTGKVKIDRSDEVENNIKRAEQFKQAGDSAKAAEYYNAALDIDADNKIAQQRIKEINSQQELEDYYLIEPDVDPQENVKSFLEQLATTESIACDIYKEIAIKSVTEKYMTFYFMKAKYRCDWTATACHIYYENQTVYKDRYDSTLKRNVKEPVTEKVRRVNRVPQSGTHIFDAEELVLASDSLEKQVSIESNNAKRALIDAFETQQDSKYSTYDTKRINPQEVKKEGGHFVYKGLILDAKVDKRTYSDRKNKMADAASERAAPEIKRSIGGDYYENLNAIRTTLSESVAYICIPVQIIEYTYKGKHYVAVSDLLSHTSTIPMIYPCDTEMDKAIGGLKTQQKQAEKNTGLIAGLVIVGIGFLCLLLGLLPGLAEFLMPVMLVCMFAGLLTMLIGLGIQKSRQKKFKASASEIKKKLFDPRINALEMTKKQFFEEYTDYASAQSAAAGAECLQVQKIHPALSKAGIIRKKMGFVINEVEGDDTIAALESGIQYHQKSRNINILITLLAGVALGVLSIILLNEIIYMHTLCQIVMYIITIGGFLAAFAGSIVILGNTNRKIKDYRFAVAAHKQRKQFREEFAETQENQQKTTGILAQWTEERVTETVEQIKKTTDKTGTKKERAIKWLKAHKVLLIILASVVLLLGLTVAVEEIICSVNSVACQKSLIGKVYDDVSDLYHTTYRFKEGNCEYSLARIGEKDNAPTEMSYRVHYDMISEEYVLSVGHSLFEIHTDSDGQIDYFTRRSSRYRLNNNPENSQNNEPVEETDVPESTSGETSQTKESESFEQLLQSAKYWAIRWKDSYGEYTVFYGFEDTGTCYMLLSAGYEVIGKGVGSYRVDENAISFDITSDGIRSEYSYRYDPENSTFIQTTIEGLAYNHTKGDRFSVEPAGATGAGKIQEFFGAGATNSGGGSSGSGSSGSGSSGSGSSGSGSSGSGSSGSGSSGSGSSGSGSSGSGSSGSGSSGSTTAKVCTRCGGKYPYVTFSSNTSTCDGCNYYSQGGGSDEKLICAKCGADCTFRGLEENGLCEDCYFSSSSSNSSSSDNTSSGNTSSGTTTQQPTTCSHTYSDATCTTPETCTRCGKTRGTAAGHKWETVTKEVYHEEKGHYEDVQNAYKVQKYRCPLCSYSQPTYDTLSAYYSHFDSSHGSNANSGFHRERYEMVEDWAYETETKWVVDQEAYTETVTVGRKCSVCGEEG